MAMVMLGLVQNYHKMRHSLSFLYDSILLGHGSLVLATPSNVVLRSK